jgi:hypothetical protein
MKRAQHPDTGAITLVPDKEFEKYLELGYVDADAPEEKPKSARSRRGNASTDDASAK